MRWLRFQEKLHSGEADANLRFDELIGYLVQLGFAVRLRGSHHILSHPGVPDILTLQRDGARCKTYQVRQVRKLLAQHKLRL